MSVGTVSFFIFAIVNNTFKRFRNNLLGARRIKMRVTVAQLNPIVGDVEGNLKKILDILPQCRSEQSDLVVFPELFLTGYPPRDFLERTFFIEKTQRAIEELVTLSKKYTELGILFGAPTPTGKETGKRIYNSALLVFDGCMLATQHKSLLPAYDVFDETRYFDPSPSLHVIPFKDEVLGISVCEDAWNDPAVFLKRRIYASDPIEKLVGMGATLLINISASPFHKGKEELRHTIIRNHAVKCKVPFVYVNQIGGNDELIFDGRSMCLDRQGCPVAIFPSFKEHVQTVDMKQAGTPGLYAPQDKVESVYEALILGIKDYMRKCGFSKTVVGLSGGIDSALTCILAKEACGKQNVLGISMPSPFSSPGSIEDSRRLAGTLGIQFEIISITGIYHSYLETLREFFGEGMDVTEENIQARIRGNILMAFSNKFGYLVLSTGNKSELAVGYCTLYGDMNGGLAVLSDVPKTMVYELAHYINREGEVISKEILEKPPSAELRPNQTDQDTLPPYPLLDQILHYYIEEGCSQEEIASHVGNPDTVRWVIGAVDRNEYKRRQAAPGLKVTTKAFGVGRRMPIAAKV